MKIKIFKKKYLKIVIPILIVVLIVMGLKMRIQSQVAGLSDDFGYEYYGEEQSGQQTKYKEEIKMDDAEAILVAIAENDEYTIKKGEIEMTISGKGNIESKFIKEIKSTNNGTVRNVYVEEGEKINKGDKILDLSSSDSNIDIEDSKLIIFNQENAIENMEEEVEGLSVKAPFSGVISELEGENGDDVSENEKLLKLIDKSTMELKVPFNASLLENLKVATGDACRVLLMDQLLYIDAKITKISSTGYGSKTGGLLKDVTVEIDNPGTLTEDVKGRVVLNNKNGEVKSVESSTFKWAESKEVVYEIGGEIVDILVENDQYVEEGQVLATLSNEDYVEQLNYEKKKLNNMRKALKEKLDKLDEFTIYSPINGVVESLKVLEEEKVMEGQLLSKVVDLNNLEIAIGIDELDILKISKDQEVVIDILPLENKRFNGIVSKINPSGNVQGGVTNYDVTIDVNYEDDEMFSKIMLGMSSTVTIIIDSRAETVVAPIEFIQNEEGIDYIQKSINGNYEKTEVQLGIVSNNFVEIIFGLEEGDEIKKWAIQ